MTEARAYLGMSLNLAGRPDEARPHLEWVVKNGNRNFIEYTLARSELLRLARGSTARLLAPGNPPLTREVSDAVAEFLAFLLTELGKPFVADQQFKDEWAKMLAARYVNRTAEERERLLHVPELWASIRASWPQMSEEERAKYRAEWREAFQAGADRLAHEGAGRGRKIAPDVAGADPDRAAAPPPAGGTPRGRRPHGRRGDGAPTVGRGAERGDGRADDADRAAVPRRRPARERNLDAAEPTGESVGESGGRPAGPERCRPDGAEDEQQPLLDHEHDPVHEPTLLKRFSLELTKLRSRRSDGGQRTLEARARTGS